MLSCEGQLARGHDVALVYGPIYGPEGSMLERVQNFRSPDGRAIELIETPRLVRQLSLWKDHFAQRDLRTIIRDWHPDVVHTHSSKAGVLGRMAAWREHVPAIVHTIHGLPFHPYQSGVLNAIYIAAERYAARRCHRIVCVADAMRVQALAAGVGRPEQYDIVYSGMEIESFLNPAWSRREVRAELGLEDDAFVIGTVARLAELKGHDDLIDALAPMMRSDARLRMLWVGDGWWRDRLVSRLDEAGIREQVILPGLVPPQEVPKYLQAMDVLVHPSYREGLPRTAPQALLSATPLIAYDVDGTREVCIDFETGRLIEPGNRDDLAAAVRWMIEHPQERQATAERGRALCKSRFAVAVMVDQLEKVYAACRAEDSHNDDIDRDESAARQQRDRAE